MCQPHFRSTYKYPPLLPCYTPFIAPPTYYYVILPSNPNPHIIPSSHLSLFLFLTSSSHYNLIHVPLVHPCYSPLSIYSLCEQLFLILPILLPSPLHILRSALFIHSVPLTYFTFASYSFHYYLTTLPYYFRLPALYAVPEPHLPISPYMSVPPHRIPLYSTSFHPIKIWWRPHSFRCIHCITYILSSHPLCSLTRMHTSSHPYLPPSSIFELFIWDQLRSCSTRLSWL